MISKARRTIGRTALAALLVAALAACGNDEPVPQSPSTPTATPTPTPPPMVDYLSIANTVADEFAKNGLKESDQTKGGGASESLGQPCGKFVNAPTAVARWHSYEQAKPLPNLSLYIFGFETDTGVAVVEKIQAAMAGCAAWIKNGQYDMAFIGEIQAAAPSGVDKMAAYCHTLIPKAGPSKGGKFFSCEAHLSRGHLMVTASALSYEKDMTEATVKDNLARVAAALVAAVPNPGQT